MDLLVLWLSRTQMWASGAGQSGLIRVNFCQQQRELIDILEQRFLLEATLRASVDLQFVDHGKVL
ncbi:hypothetical protein [Arthrobacter sp. Rue61a]|uniref:hypothetical protein n=1 Tax=Arthrobacter sp. Rue61a TaxID=1118963 RepID=UPI0005B8451C|nr:hypothetical protein [Arthrobacter sp. Rue61a]